MPGLLATSAPFESSTRVRRSTAPRVQDRVACFGSVRPTRSTVPRQVFTPRSPRRQVRSSAPPQRDCAGYAPSLDGTRRPEPDARRPRRSRIWLTLALEGPSRSAVVLRNSSSSSERRITSGVVAAGGPAPMRLPSRARHAPALTWRSGEALEIGGSEVRKENGAQRTAGRTPVARRRPEGGDAVLRSWDAGSAAPGRRVVPAGGGA